MRTTLTIIMRLLVDQENPDELRGALHCIYSDVEHTFGDAQALLKLLRLTQRELLLTDAGWQGAIKDDESIDIQ